MASTLYQQWITRLRVSWMGLKGQRIFGAFAATLGDQTVDWAQQGVLEHMPTYALDPTSVALIASERQLDTYPGEPVANIQARAPYWIEINKFRGRPLGLLLGLHFAGFDGAVVVQQNGLAYQLTLPLPAFSGNWDPTPNLVTTSIAQLAVALTPVAPAVKIIPASATRHHSTPWWTIDNNTDCCSRFQVLFPGPVFPPSFTTWARVTFAGTDTAVATWNNTFPSSSYVVDVGGVTVTDSGGAVMVTCDGTTRTPTQVTLSASAPFTGYVDVLAHQTGVNPWADPHPSDLARLRTVVKKWEPAKSKCMGVFVLTQGKFAAWPVSTMGAMLGVPSTVVSLAGPF